MNFFTYDEKFSEDYCGGLFVAKFEKIDELQSGLTREILKGETNSYRHIANHFGTKYTDTINFKCSVMKKDFSPFTMTEINDVNKWLTSPKYPRHLCFISCEGKAYYYNGLFTEVTYEYASNGVMAINYVFVNSSPFMYESYSETVEISGGSGSSSLVIDINCDSGLAYDYIYPEFTFQYVPADGVSLVSAEDDGVAVVSEDEEENLLSPMGDSGLDWSSCSGWNDAELLDTRHYASGCFVQVSYISNAKSYGITVHYALDSTADFPAYVVKDVDSNTFVLKGYTYHKIAYSVNDVFEGFNLNELTPTEDVSYGNGSLAYAPRDVTNNSRVATDVDAFTNLPTFLSTDTDAINAYLNNGDITGALNYSDIAPSVSINKKLKTILFNQSDKCTKNGYEYNPTLIFSLPITKTLKMDCRNQILTSYDNKETFEVFGINEYQEETDVINWVRLLDGDNRIFVVFTKNEDGETFDSTDKVIVTYTYKVPKKVGEMFEY